MDTWDALPNARTVRFGTYDDLFLTSDGMIMDCASFLTEYTLVDKPLIFLRRPEQPLNEWADMLLGVAYSVPGDQPDVIGEVLDNVIIRGNDYLKEKRSVFIQNYLNPYKDFSDGSSTASEWIFHYIDRAVNTE